MFRQTVNYIHPIQPALVISVSYTHLDVYKRQPNSIPAEKELLS